MPCWPQGQYPNPCSWHFLLGLLQTPTDSIPGSWWSPTILHNAISTCPFYELYLLMKFIHLNAIDVFPFPTKWNVNLLIEYIQVFPRLLHPSFSRLSLAIPHSSTMAAPPAEWGSSHCPDSCWGDETGWKRPQVQDWGLFRREPRASLGMWL